MFDSVLSSFGGDLESLFSTGLAGAARGFASGSKASGASLKETNSILNLLDNGIGKLGTDTNIRKSQGEPAQSVNMEAIEAAWVARLAKYAGIAGASGVKLS